MKRVFIASVSVAALLGIGQAQAGHGTVVAIHAGLTCYEFKLTGSPNWYAIPMIGTGYASQAAEVSGARGTSTAIGFDLTGGHCSDTSPDGLGVVPVPSVANVNIPPLTGQ